MRRSSALLEDWLFRFGITTAVHNHEEGLRGDKYCPGCHEESVRRPQRQPNEATSEGVGG